ncbi:alpha/beta hydrolase [Qipengyuania sp.]|uniref:alpha/beta hydrolase n=1 Tax=Qipengyuania sp. TaxID=2004515 RepID=UPI003BAABE2E
MPFIDKSSKDLLDRLEAAGPPPAELEQQRAGFSALWQSLSPVAPEVARQETVELAGVESLVYWPESTGVDLPLVIFYHGGGGIMLNPEDFDPTSRMIANKAGAIVVVPRYRKAPENRFPAPLEDCFAVYQSLARQPSQIEGAGSKIAVAGDSAGGYLAAAVAQEAKRLGIEPPVGQVLIYPMLDMASYSPSRFENDYFTSHEAIEGTVALHFGDQVLDPRASPLREPDLSDLPEAMIIASDIDCLFDEARAYAHRLRAASVPCSFFVYEGQVHGFFSFGATMPEGNRCVTHVAGWLRDTFSAASAE